jgi:octaprenyl-diphosphate synthase
MPGVLPTPRTDSLVARPRPTLAGIRAPIEDDLAAFRAHFRDSMRSRVGLLDKVTQYVLRQKGKELRPILVLLSAQAAGGVTDRSYTAAALVELLHTATLVHDDVVDEAERRRGMFSINALWKNKVAVLFGDFLLSRGLLMALERGEYALLHTVSDAVRRMSEGELLQIEKARRMDIDEETYFRIISDKTASLLAACTAAGARSATDDDEVVHNLRQAGESLGLAFQIRDDLFDYGAADVGKPLGLDLKERKMTLPLIAALQGASDSDRRRIRRLVRKKRKSARDVSEVQAFVRQRGGIDTARERMVELAEEAAARFEALPPTPAREALLDVAAYVVDRKK